MEIAASAALVISLNPKGYSHYLDLPVSTLSSWLRGQIGFQPAIGLDGDSLADLAQDHDPFTRVIEEAIRCELSGREAA
ncbi:MAG: hypothetical protein KF911_08260 [Pseudomonadales bacterium]|nr:hypothetical protein [Pseudomonadales bacterium]